MNLFFEFQMKFCIALNENKKNSVKIITLSELFNFHENVFI